MTYSSEDKLDDLKRAICRLKEVLALAESDIIRDAAIRRLIFTVELSWKVLQRHIRSSGISEVLTPKNTFREGARLGLIKDPEAWIKFVDARNLSSHTYKESLAEEVYSSALILPSFADDLVRAIEQAR